MKKEEAKSLRMRRARVTAEPSVLGYLGLSQETVSSQVSFLPDEERVSANKKSAQSDLLIRKSSLYLSDFACLK